MTIVKKDLTVVRSQTNLFTVFHGRLRLREQLIQLLLGRLRSFSPGFASSVDALL